MHEERTRKGWSGKADFMKIMCYEDLEVEDLTTAVVPNVHEEPLPFHQRVMNIFRKIFGRPLVFPKLILVMEKPKLLPAPRQDEQA